MPHSLGSLSRRSGFTLIEVLVVATVAALIIGSVVTGVQVMRGKAGTAAMQGELSRLLEAQALYYQTNRTPTDDADALGVPANRMLGNDVEFIGAVTEGREYAIAVQHPQGGACVAYGNLGARESAGGGIACDRQYDLPVTVSVAGSVVSVDASAAYPVGLLASIWGPEEAFAAPIDEVAWVFWSFGRGVSRGGRPANATSTTHGYSGDATERTVKLMVMYRNGRLRTGTYNIAPVGDGGNNKAPIPQIRLHNGVFVVGQRLHPDGRGSYDPDGDIVSYTWTYSGGLPGGNGPRDAVTFLAPGTYTITLTVVDNLGASAVESRTITVTGTSISNVGPVAQFRANPNPAQPGIAVSLDGGRSLDADGRIVRYEWLVSGLGPDVALEGREVTFAPSITGTGTVRLVVTDDQGATDTLQQTLRSVGANQPPTLVVAPGSQSVREGLAADFTATASDPENGGVTLTWDFGDGSVGAGAATSRRYSRAGTYTVRVVARDSAGETTSGTASVTVVANRPPTATGITVTPTQPSPGVPAALNVIGAVDPDGDIRQVRWLLSDGTYLLGDSVNHTFTTPGMQYLSVTLRDDFGAETTIQDSVLVGGVPEASFVTSALPAIVGEPITFDASASTSPTGVIGAYVWSFGDGTTDSLQVPGRVHTYVAGVPGEAVMSRLIVWNEDFSAADTMSAVIPVTARPTASIAPGTSTVGFGTLVNFTSSAVDPDGGPVAILWDFGGEGTATTAAASHTFSGAGSFLVTLTVADSFGVTTNTSPLTSTITVATQPTVSLSAAPDSVYPTQPVTLTSVVGTDGAQGAVVARALWDLGDGRVDSTATGNRTISYPTPGTYTIVVRIRDNFGGLSAPDSTVVVVVGSPIASFTVSPSTTDTTLRPFTMTSTTTGPAGYALQWLVDGAAVPADSLTTFVRSFGVRGEYVVRLIASYGPVADTAEATLTVINRPPTASFVVTPLNADSTVRMSTVLSAVATAGDPDGGALDYHWTINGVPQVGFRGPRMTWAPGKPDTLIIGLRVFDRQGDSVVAENRTVYVTDVPLAGATITSLPGPMVGPGSIAGFLVAHNLRPNRTHTYSWTVVSYAASVPDTTFATGPSPYLPLIASAAGDSIVGWVVITDDLGESLPAGPGVIRAQHLPESVGFRCMPDALGSTLETTRCEFDTPGATDVLDSMVAQGNPTVTVTGALSREFTWSTPGTYSVRAYYRPGPTGSGLEGSALTTSDDVQVDSRGLTGVDFTVNGNLDAAADSAFPAFTPRLFEATGTDLEGGAVSFAWYINGGAAPWSTRPTWRLALAQNDAPWVLTGGVGYDVNTVRLVAYNRLGDSVQVTKDLKWSRCDIATGARVRMGSLVPALAPVNGPRPGLGLRRWWCGGPIPGAVATTLFVRAVRDGTPEPWIRYNQLRTGERIPLDSAVAPGQYWYHLQYYMVGRPDTVTVPDSVRSTWYAGPIPANQPPYIEELLPQSNVMNGPFTMTNHSNATGSGATHTWRVLARDANGGILTVRWYFNGVLTATQTQNRTPGQQLNLSTTVNPNTLPEPFRNSYYSVDVTVTDPLGQVARLGIDTVRVGRVQRGVTLANINITPAPDTMPGTPSGLIRYAFRPRVDYTFNLGGGATNAGSRVTWLFPDGTTAEAPLGTSVVKRFTHAVVPSETHGFGNPTGRFTVEVIDSAAGSWDPSVVGPVTDVRYGTAVLGGTDSVLTGNNSGLSAPGRVMNTPPVARIQFPLSAGGAQDTSVVLGDSLRVSADVYDPDNESYTLAWFLDDSLVSTNKSWVWQANGRTGRRVLRLRAEDPSGDVGEEIRSPIVLEEALFARLAINATYIRQSETGDTTFYAATSGAPITLDPSNSVVPDGLLGALRSRLWSGAGSPPDFSAGLPAPTIPAYPVTGGLFYPGVTLLSGNGSVVRSNPIALCLLGPPASATLARNLTYEFLGRSVRQIEVTWIPGGCSGDESRIYRQTSDADTPTLDGHIPASQSRLLRDYLMDGAPDSLYLSVRHSAGALESDPSNRLEIPWGLGTAAEVSVMPPVAEAEHDGRLFAAMPMGVAVARPDSVITFTSVTQGGTSTVWSVNGGPFLPGASGTMTGCAPISAVTSFTIRTMRLRVTNVGGTSQREWRVACGTNPVIGSPPSASTDTPGPLSWHRGDTLWINSTSTDPEGGLASVIWQIREAPDASEWVPLSLDGTSITFVGTGNTIAADWFGGGTPSLRITPRTHFPQGLELRLVVIDADDQVDSTGVISMPYLGNRAPTASLVRNPVGAVNTGTVITFTAVCSDPENDTPFTYAWSATNRTGPNGGVSATYNMADNGVTNVTMVCTDLYGAADTATLSGTWNNRAPNRGTLNVFPAGPVGLTDTLTFTNTGYSDPDGTVVAWQWQIIEPDGGTRTRNSAVPTFTYPLESGVDGTVQVRMRIQDDDGTWTGWSGYVTRVMGNPNQIPLNNGIFDPATNGFVAGLGVPTDLTGACTDLDGDPLTYRWRVNGVTVYSGASSTYSHAWAATGAITLTFDCFDGTAWSAAATRTGTVINTAPVATLVHPAEGFLLPVGVVDTLTATAVDAEGHAITAYQWQVNGVTVGTTATPSFEYTWPATAGAYVVGVAARDVHGLWGAYDTNSGTLTEEVAQGSVVADDPAALHTNSMTFTAVGFTGATNYAWTIDGVAAGTGVSITPTMSNAGLRDIEVTATNAFDSKGATLANYCVLGVPGTNSPAQAWDDLYNSGGLTYWDLDPNNKRMRWSYPTCGDDSAVILQSVRIGAGAWSAYNDYATFGGTMYNVPDMPARDAGIGAPNIFYRYGIQVTAASGAVRGPLVTIPEWETVP